MIHSFTKSVLIGILIPCLLTLPLAGCSQQDADTIMMVDEWSRSVEVPPETTPQDLTLRQKADVIVLPTISVVAWTIGVVVAYMSAQIIYTSTQEDFAYFVDGLKTVLIKINQKSGSGPD